MVSATRNRPKAVNVSKTAIDQVGSLLQDLSAKPREEMSLREAIDQLREPIRGALAKGYNYEDIVAILGEKGIATTAATVKRYISIGNTRKRKTRGSAAKVDRTPTTLAEADEAPSTTRKKTAKTAPAEAEPAKTTRGRKPASSSTSKVAKSTSTATTTRGRKK
jgi:hypothetical protein